MSIRRPCRPTRACRGSSRSTGPPASSSCSAARAAPASARSPLELDVHKSTAFRLLGGPRGPRPGRAEREPRQVPAGHRRAAAGERGLPPAEHRGAGPAEPGAPGRRAGRDGQPGRAALGLGGQPGPGDGPVAAGQPRLDRQPDPAARHGQRQGLPRRAERRGTDGADRRRAAAALHRRDGHRPRPARRRARRRSRRPASRARTASSRTG